MSVSATTELPEVSSMAPAPSLLKERLSVPWTAIPVVTACAAFFTYLNYIPLFYTDIWGHVGYGKWMLEHRALPTEDPCLPLSAGVPVDTSWLSQLLFGWLASVGGAEALSLVFTVTLWCTYFLYTRAFYLLSGRIWLALIGTFLTWFLGFGRHSIIRPEIFGGLCFATLIWMVVHGEPWRSRSAKLACDEELDARPPWLLWIGIPVLFLAWANLHGSFMIGLIVLGCHAVGRTLQVLWTRRSLWEVLRDRWVIRWTLLTELALGATLINPYGVDLLIESVLFGRNENLKDILEWYELKLVDAEGIQFSVAVLLWLGLYRFSRQRVSPTDILLPLVFAAGMALVIRIIGWFAGVFALCMMPHITEVGSRLQDRWAARRRRGAESDRPESRRFVYTLVCLLVAWSAFALAPMGRQVLGGQPRPPASQYNERTPLGITKFLRENPPRGLVYAPQWWSDWLAWDGPPNIKTVVSTNIHLAPKRLWDGYMRVSKGETYWDNLLDRWAVQAVVVDKEKQKKLASEVRGSAVWKVIYEDDLGFIATRRTASTSG